MLTWVVVSVSRLALRERVLENLGSVTDYRLIYDSQIVLMAAEYSLFVFNLSKEEVAKI